LTEEKPYILFISIKVRSHRDCLLVTESWVCGIPARNSYMIFWPVYTGLLLHYGHFILWLEKASLFAFANKKHHER